MALTATVTEAINIGGVEVTRATVYTDEAATSIDKAVADAATNFLIALVQDVSETSVVYIVSDQVVTLEFNNSTTGEPEMVLVANVPYVWHTNSYLTDLLTTDITKLYVTNASGSTANVKIRFLYDATP